jgi:serine/threonine protein phosphatase PrpC
VIEKRARAAEDVAVRAALFVQSAGREGEDEKDQDRVRQSETRDGDGVKYQFAIVCDGTSTSPFAADAAAYVSAQVGTLFEEGGLRRVVDSLKEMRTELLGKPLQLDEEQSELLRSMFEEIVRQKYQSAYQTTFIAVRLKRDEDGPEGAATITAIACGDSALFIFREDGELLYNNMNLADASDPFKHVSPFTAVLPDSYDEAKGHVLVEALEVAKDVHLLLCSDGFYDGFKNFREVLDWLHEHRDELRDSASCDLCTRDLHQRLEQKNGDDDISFIWLLPVAPPPKGPPESEEKESVAAGCVDIAHENAEDRSPGPYGRLRSFLLRLFNRARRNPTDDVRRRV